MEITPSDLQQRMLHKSIGELETIIDSPPGDYTSEARAAAAAALATKRTSGENSIEQDTEAPNVSRRSMFAKTVAVIAALAAIRELVRILSKLFFR
jgi:hypothetical protein